MDGDGLIQQIVNAWQFIFNNHPDGETVMAKVMDPDARITQGQFEIWFHEARAAI